MGSSEVMVLERENSHNCFVEGPDDQTVTVFIVHILEQVAFTLGCAFHLENSFASVGGVWVPFLQDVISFP